MRARLKTATLILLALAMTGCLSTRIQLHQTLPPRAPDAAIAVYCYDAPDGWKHELVAEIEAVTDNEYLNNFILDAFKKRAREVGAEALVIRGRQQLGTTVYSSANGSSASNTVRFLALAVVSANPGKAVPDNRSGSRSCLPR